MTDKEDRNNLIIFGAGASYGSQNSFTPPLGNKLFVSLKEFNPAGWGQLPKGLENVFEEDFESAMSQINPHQLSVLQRAMAYYFFQFKPTYENLYYKLVSEIIANKTSVSFVSFNYERLLEISIAALNLIPVTGIADRNKNEMEICIPHGMCNIFCDSVKAQSGSMSFSGLNVAINGDLKVVIDPTEFEQRILNDAIPPVMSYFEPQKRTTAGTEFINIQRQRYEELVLTANRIFIIGLKVREHDAHIWNPLSNTNAKIYYCSGKVGNESFKNFKNLNRPNSKDIILDGYFLDNFDFIINELA